MTRRHDVDGLRAVAISLVLIFHCFPAALPGGFVGVDVFFVISGFLITGGLIADLDAKRFSIRDFYVRRGRRILPALFVTLGATAALGLAILFEPERRALGKHILTALRFGSNFTLMRETGYFDTASDLKPLLHLWSLAIEEQFYLVLPPLLWLAGRRAWTAITCLTLASLAANAHLWLTHSPYFFYHPLARFWEPLAGGVLAGLAPAPKRWREGLAVAGLAAIAAALVINAGHRPYPDPGALPVVLGTLALLWAGAGTVVARRLLAPRFMTAVGAISYPLYLWHWPLLAYARLEFGARLPTSVAAGVVVASVGLATATYLGVEKPFRRRSARTQLVTTVVAALALLALGDTFRARLRGYHPLPDSMTLHRDFEGLVDKACGVSEAGQEFVTFCGADRRGPATRAVWGDSKADAIFPALVRRSAAGARWTMLGKASCAPVVGMRRTSFAIDDGTSCQQSNDLSLQRLVGDPAITFVLIVTANRILFKETYGALADPRRTRDVDEGVIAAVAALTAAGKTVGFLLDNPTLEPANLCVARPWDVGVARPGCAQPLARYRADNRRMAALAAAIQRKFPRALIFDPAAQLCAGDTCAVTLDGKSLYSYFDHLSDFGAGRVADEILRALAR